MGRSVSHLKSGWSPVFPLASQVIWGCSESTGAGTLQTWTLLCLFCLLKSDSVTPSLFLVSFFMHRVTSGCHLDGARWEAAVLPAEHGEALAVVPARGSDGSQGHPSPEGRHAPRPGAAGWGQGQGQGHSMALQHSRVTISTRGRAALPPCAAELSSLRSKWSAGNLCGFQIAAPSGWSFACSPTPKK